MDERKRLLSILTVWVVALPTGAVAEVLEFTAALLKRHLDDPQEPLNAAAQQIQESRNAEAIVPGPPGGITQ